jgi:hypothetical protein
MKLPNDDEVIKNKLSKKCANHSGKTRRELELIFFNGFSVSLSAAQAKQPSNPKACSPRNSLLR